MSRSLLSLAPSVPALDNVVAARVGDGSSFGESVQLQNELATGMTDHQVIEPGRDLRFGLWQRAQTKPSPLCLVGSLLPGVAIASYTRTALTIFPIKPRQKSPSLLVAGALGSAVISVRFKRSTAVLGQRRMQPSHRHRRLYLPTRAGFRLIAAVWCCRKAARLPRNICTLLASC
jgi:hypothetical protein